MRAEFKLYEYLRDTTERHLVTLQCASVNVLITAARLIEQYRTIKHSHKEKLDEMLAWAKEYVCCSSWYSAKQDIT